MQNLPPAARPAPPPFAVRPAPLAPLARSNWPLGLALLIAGGVGWLSGARYTLLGWGIGANLFFAWLGLPVTIPTPTGWWILLLIPVGIAYSWGERRIFRVRTAKRADMPQIVIGWLLIVITDVFTTYLGVRAPAADAWAITQMVGASVGLALLWACILTFVSDWMIDAGWKLL